MPLLLAQQAVSFVDIAFDGEFVNSSYSLLALQVQWRRGFSCWPQMVHADCGSALDSWHSFDVAVMDLLDLVPADISFDHICAVCSFISSVTIIVEYLENEN